MRTLRTTIVILLFLSLLALSLVGALTLYATPERVTARAAAMLESHLGLRAELSGDVELKRLPKLILRIPAGELIHTKDSMPADLPAQKLNSPHGVSSLNRRVSTVFPLIALSSTISRMRNCWRTQPPLPNMPSGISTNSNSLRHPFVLMLCRMLAQVCSQRSMPNFPISLKLAERCVWRVR